MSNKINKEIIFEWITNNIKVILQILILYMIHLYITSARHCECNQ